MYLVGLWVPCMSYYHFVMYYLLVYYHNKLFSFSIADGLYRTIATTTGKLSPSSNQTVYNMIMYKVKMRMPESSIQAILGFSRHLLVTCLVISGSCKYTALMSPSLNQKSNQYSLYIYTSFRAGPVYSRCLFYQTNNKSLKGNLLTDAISDTVRPSLVESLRQSRAFLLTVTKVSRYVPHDLLVK